MRAGTAFEWVVPHTYRKTVATWMDAEGSSARTIADQLGHSRISMTQDVYMGRRAVDASAARVLRAVELPLRIDTEESSVTTGGHRDGGAVLDGDGRRHMASALR